MSRIIQKRRRTTVAHVEAMNLLTSTQAELKESKQRCAAEENLRKQQEERSKQEIDQLREELQQLQVSKGENRERKQQEERGWEEIDQLWEEIQQLHVSKGKTRERRRGFWKRIQRLWKN
ncbi:unnamed protein product [Tetraodon nigroviridis]|uniref:(spotted green pufferfish) hypothetical protein n=1 Tax=Tetraodon nigroviridis TaxID=99883 RepID=Q4TE54_TETNG|nr:unnamed protein product [Tetraodon nigroviridis]